MDWINIALESRCFTFDQQDALLDLYACVGMRQMEDNLSSMVQGLLSIFISLQQIPRIHFYDGKGDRQSPSAHLALRFRKERQVLEELGKTWPKATRDADLILVDRNIDLIAPFLTNLSYEAACYDLLETSQCNVKIPCADEVSATPGLRSIHLDESDPIFVKKFNPG